MCSAISHIWVVHLNIWWQLIWIDNWGDALKIYTLPSILRQRTWIWFFFAIKINKLTLDIQPPLFNNSKCYIQTFIEGKTCRGEWGPGSHPLSRSSGLCKQQYRGCVPQHLVAAWVGHPFPSCQIHTDGRPTKSGLSLTRYWPS